MNKKIIMPIALAVLLSLAVFVSANSFFTSDEGYKTKYTFNVDVEKGWNNLMTFYPQFIQSESEIKEQDVKAVFLYSPDKNKYVEIYPSFDLPNAGLNSNDEYYDDSALFYSHWVYFDKSGTLTYSFRGYENILENSLNENMIALKRGWNFVGINPSFIGKTLNEIKGDCNFEKVYLWMPQKQEWEEVSADEQIPPGVLTNGLTLKVSSSCTLGSSSSVINPPVIPENDGSSEETTQEMCVETDNGKDIINKGVTEKGVTNGRDVCTTKQIDGSDVTTTNCIGEDCFIIEFYCQENKVSYDKISCPNGCNDGACID